MTESRQIDERGDIFAQIFRHSIIPTIIHDLDMTILDANDSALAEFGYSAAEIKHKTVFDLHPADELDHSEQVLNDIKAATKLSVETRFKRKDGSTFDAEATPCTFQIGGKTVIHVFLQDITQRKQSERQIREFNRQLQTEVEQRTRDLQQKAEALVESNQHLENFAFMASHDLQAPLRHIQYFTQTLMEDVNQLPSDARHNIERLMDSVTRLRNRIEALLKFSRVQRTDIELSPLNLNEALAQIETELDEDLARAGGHLSWHELPTVNADGNLLPLLLQNLISNALRYRGTGDPFIEVRGAIDGDTAVLTVKDNGRGFDPRFNERIFKAFERLEHDSAGTGMGLAICKLIVDRHGGSISAQGCPGEGATFTIRLPRPG